MTAGRHPSNLIRRGKIRERLARLDPDREKIAAQLADIETAERGLTRVSKAPPSRRPRSSSAEEAKNSGYPARPRAAAKNRHGAVSPFDTSQRGQPLFGSSEQPFHCLGSVSFDATAIVIQTTVVEDTDIKLRRGVAAFGGNKQVL